MAAVKGMAGKKCGEGCECGRHNRAPFTVEHCSRISKGKRGSTRAAHKVGCKCMFCGPGVLCEKGCTCKRHVNSGVYERNEKHSCICKPGCECKRHINTGRYERTVEHRFKIGAAARKVWKRPAYRRKMVAILNNISRNSFSKGPNNLEKRFTELTGLPFVGDGSIRIGGKWPDFVVREKRKVIEVYGCYWHDCPTCNDDSKFIDPDPRVVLFKRHGYECLVIWEHEIHQNPWLVKSRVAEYLDNG